MVIDYAKDYINVLVRKQQLPDIEITSFSRRAQHFRPTITTKPLPNTPYVTQQISRWFWASFSSFCSKGYSFFAVAVLIRSLKFFRVLDTRMVDISLCDLQLWKELFIVNKILLLILIFLITMATCTSTFYIEQSYMREWIICALINEWFSSEECIAIFNEYLTKYMSCRLNRCRCNWVRLYNNIFWNIEDSMNAIYFSSDEGVENILSQYNSCTTIA
jgi:hypothetical protein